MPENTNTVGGVALPIRRTTGETIEDRLTTNAYQEILPSRYVLKDEDGEQIEAADEIFERVAKNIAVAEAVHVDEEIQIDTWHIKPDHPRRAELFEAVLNNVEAGYAELTEENAKWIAYDRLMDDTAISDATKKTLRTWKERYQEQMERLHFMPNSPTLMNAGDELQQLSACFVNSPADDISDIHETAKEAAEVFQSGGGMGYAFSYLRPYGDSVGSTGGIASGPITFMRTFDQMCETIAQGGTRRGAQMGTMRVSHPDVIEFIHAKNKDVSLAHTLKLNDPDDYTYTSFGEALEEARELIDEDGRVPKHLRNAVEGHLSNFNISVCVTEEFMEAAMNGEDYAMINPRTGEQHIATEETEEMYSWFDMDQHVTPGEPLAVPADELLDRIVQGSHENGEPGIIFLDRCNEDHSYPVESTPEQNFDSEPHEIHSTNPCGEQPLQEYEACNLGHINLSTIVDQDAPDWREWDGDVHEFLQEAIDMAELNERIRVGTRFLDNVVTMSAFPIEEIEQTVRENRKIGLGIMGLAQMFIQLGVRYGSDEGNEIARQLMRHINQQSKLASHDLARDRGVFVNWDESKYADPQEYPEWFSRQTGKVPRAWEDGYAMRNHNTTTIAPTGTTSMIANTTGGCEPIYNVAYYKNVTDDVQGDEMLVEFDDYFLDVLRANDIDVQAVKEEAMDQMAANEFDGITGLSTVPDAIGELFVVTSDLSGRDHASVQCALQEGVDSAISKTCNFPNSATVDDVREVIEYLYANGAKGATLYRDGTRSKQVLTTRADNKAFAGDGEVTPEAVADATADMDASEAQRAIEAIAAEHDVALAEDDEDAAEDEDIPLRQSTRERPEMLDGVTQRIQTGYGTLYVTITEDEFGEPFEIFTNIGNSGGLQSGFTEALAKVCSIALRSGTDPDEIEDTLRGIKSPQVGWDNGRQVQSIPDALAVALERYQEKHDRDTDHDRDPDSSLAVKRTIDTDSEPEPAIESDTGTAVMNDGGGPGAGEECPECDRMTLMISEGCQTCQECGFSKC